MCVQRRFGVHAGVGTTGLACDTILLPQVAFLHRRWLSWLVLVVLCFAMQ